MKILILAGQFYPDLAGSGIATCLIARFMAERGHNVTVCVDEDNRYLSEVNGHPDFKIIHIPEYKDFMTGLAGFGKPARAIAKELRKNSGGYSTKTRYPARAIAKELRKNYDVVHVYSYMPMLLLSTLGDIIGDTKVFFTFWNAPDIGKRALGFYDDSPLDLSLARFIIESGRYHKMVLGSKASYNSALHLGAKSELTSFCYHGIDLKAFRESLYRDIDVFSKYFNRRPTANRLILLPGRITQRKGVEEAIYALSEVSRKYDAQLLLTSDGRGGRYEEAVKRLATLLNVNDRILISNKPVSQEDMGALYKSVNISIIPSYYEGLGFTAIESLAASLPTIVSNTSGLDEIGINGYNCLTVEPRNSRSLADAIIRLLGDDKLQDKLMNNATSSIEKFDMRFFVDYIEDKYKKVARLG